MQPYRLQTAYFTDAVSINSTSPPSEIYLTILGLPRLHYEIALEISPNKLSIGVQWELMMMTTSELSQAVVVSRRIPNEFFFAVFCLLSHHKSFNKLSADQAPAY